MPRKSYSSHLLGTAVLVCLPLPIAAQSALDAAERPAAVVVASDSELSRLRAQIGELTARETAQQDRMRALEDRLASIETRQPGLGTPIDAQTAAGMRGAYIAPRPVMLSADPALGYFQQQDADRQPLSTGAAPPAEEPDRRAPAPTEAVEEVVRQQQGRFGSRLSLDLGISYSHFDNSRINLNGFLALDAIFLGTISIDQITTDIVSFEPTVRYGITDRLFIDASLPYLYRVSNFRSGGAGGSASALAESTVSDHGLGDASVGLSYRLLKETAGRPDVVINARVKFPTGRHPFGVEFTEVADTQGNLQVPDALATGNGVYGASIGVSALKTLDPLVVFASATYFYNFSRHFDDIDEQVGNLSGEIDIGNAYQLGAGLAFALNDKSSISMSYTQRLVGRTSLIPQGQAERWIVGSQANVGFVNLGATFSLGPQVALVANVGIGLTDDSPDMTISFRLPFRF